MRKIKTASSKSFLPERRKGLVIFPNGSYWGCSFFAIMKNYKYKIGRFITYLGLRIMGFCPFCAKLWSNFGED